MPKPLFTNENKGKTRIEDLGGQKLALENQLQLRNKWMTVFLREPRNFQGFFIANYEN